MSLTKRWIKDSYPGLIASIKIVKAYDRWKIVLD